jgi:hypothetical protein
MQIITDTMSQRPRLNLQANYFTDAYDAEIITRINLTLNLTREDRKLKVIGVPAVVIPIG